MDQGFVQVEDEALLAYMLRGDRRKERLGFAILRESASSTDASTKRTHWSNWYAISPVLNKSVFLGLFIVGLLVVRVVFRISPL